MMRDFKDNMKEHKRALSVEQVISHIEDGEAVKEKSLSKVTRDRMFKRQQDEMLNSKYSAM